MSTFSSRSSEIQNPFFVFLLSDFSKPTPFFVKSPLGTLATAELFRIIGDVASVGKNDRLNVHVLQAIPLVVIKLVQIGVILKTGGFLNHVSPIFLGGMSPGGEFKQIHVFRQAADLAGVFRLGH